MAKMKLEEKPELTTVFRKENARPGAVEVKTKRGLFYHEVLYCFGDPRNPMQWDDVGEKFTNQAQPVLGAAATKEAIAMARDIENLKDIGSLARVLGGQAA